MVSGLLKKFQGFPCASTLPTTAVTSSRTTQQCDEGDVGEISEGSKVAEIGDEQDQSARASAAYDDDAQRAENIRNVNDLDSDSFNIIEQPVTCSDRPSSDDFHNLVSLDLSSRDSEFTHYDHSKEVVVSGVSTSASDVMTEPMFTSEDDYPNVIHLSPTAGSILYQQSICQIINADSLNSQPRYSDLVGTQPQQEETYILSYEPPRFLSQFLSCDLIQSGGDDDDDEFSPLGIRNLKSTSSNCYSPCRLRDSPSRDHTPEAVLKTASKSYTPTPSILKKRHRNLRSPLSEKPFKKRISFNIDENTDKENLNPAADEMAQKEGGKTTTDKVQPPVGILLEQNLDASVENSGIFGESPLMKNLESPSAWNSPWSSFVPGPRIDTDITIEDIGYFTSPGERSQNAAGLMKQGRKHNAPAYANAQEVLGDETPDSLLKTRYSEKGELSWRRSNMLSERRVLDFNECVTPKKGGEQSLRNSSCIGFSSLSSYLLKSCR